MSRSGSPVLVIGGGGHAKVVVDLLRLTGWQVHGVLDPNPGATDVLGAPILGGDELAGSIYAQGIRHAAVAIGRNDLRLQLGRRLQGIGFALVTMVHPAAIVSSSAIVGAGVAIMALAVVNPAARIGDLAIINTAAIVEHDCVVGEGAHIAPRSVLGGNVVVGRCAQIGIGATVRPEMTIRESSADWSRGSGCQPGSRRHDGGGRFLRALTEP